jgi:hydrogenase-4 component F
MITFALLIIPLIAAAISAAVPRHNQQVLEYTAIAANAIALGLALYIAFIIVHTASTLYASSLFETDALGAFVLLFSTTVGLAAAVHSVGHLRAEHQKGIIGFSRIRQFYTLFHLFFFAMYVSATTASPIVMWVAIEATTLATAFLISFYNKPSALEAGWKHLIVNSVGLLLGFLGILLFLNAAASAGASSAFVTWKMLHAVQASLNPALIKIAFVFVIVGLGTKVGFVPMHTWLPDAHGKAPIPASSLLSGLLLNVALVAILRFRAIADAAVNPAFTAQLLIGFGILSLVVAALIIFGRRNYKRMLAYSSIEHMGVMGIGFGIGGPAALAALFHMLYHALLKPTLFFAAGNFFLKYSTTKLANVRGALKLLPVSGPVFFAGLLAVAGVPPSGIFFTELTILATGMRDHPYLMMLVIAALAVVLSGFLTGATRMLFGDPPDDLQQGEASYWTLISIGFLASLFVILSVYVPAPLMQLITRAAATIQ